MVQNLCVKIFGIFSTNLAVNLFPKTFLESSSKLWWVFFSINFLLTVDSLLTVYWETTEHWIYLQLLAAEQELNDFSEWFLSQSRRETLQFYLILTKSKFWANRLQNIPFVFCRDALCWIPYCTYVQEVGKSDVRLSSQKKKNPLGSSTNTPHIYGEWLLSYKCLIPINLMCKKRRRFSCALCGTICAGADGTLPYFYSANNNKGRDASDITRHHTRCGIIGKKIRRNNCGAGTMQFDIIR